MPNKMQQKFETVVNKDYVTRRFIMFLFVLDEDLISLVKLRKLMELKQISYFCYSFFIF